MKITKRMKKLHYVRLDKHTDDERWQQDFSERDRQPSFLRCIHTVDVYQQYPIWFYSFNSKVSLTIQIPSDQINNVVDYLDGVDGFDRENSGIMHITTTYPIAHYDNFGGNCLFYIKVNNFYVMYEILYMDTIKQSVVSLITTLKEFSER